MVTKASYHYIHNPEAFLRDKADLHAAKSYRTAYIAEMLGSSIFGLTSTCLSGRVGRGGSSKEVDDEPKKAAPQEEKEVVVEEKKEDIVKNIKTILSTSNVEIDFDSESADFQKDLISKYKVIKSVNKDITDTELTRRLTNYAKALKFHQAEVAANADDTVEYKSACAKAKTQEELVNSYEQFGAEYVELYDQDGNSSIDIHEMFYQELIDYYISEGDDRNIALAKAIKATELFKDFNLNALPAGESAEEELFKRVVQKFKTIDIDGVNGISSKESATHLLSMAQLHDKLNNISASEFLDSDLAVMFAGKSVEDIEAWIRDNQAELPEDFTPLTDSEVHNQAQEIYNNVLKYADNSGKARTLFGL